MMAKEDIVDPRVKEYFKDVTYKKWSRVHATINRGRMMTSNIWNLWMIILLMHDNYL